MALLCLVPQVGPHSNSETLATTLDGKWGQHTPELFAEGVVQGHTSCSLDLLPGERENTSAKSQSPRSGQTSVGDRLCGPARQLWHLSCECATQSPESGK